MLRAARPLLGCAALLTAAAASLATGRQCDAKAPGAGEADDDNVSLMALRFATKSAPARLDRGRTRATDETATAEDFLVQDAALVDQLQAANQTVPSAATSTANDETSTGIAEARRGAEVHAHRGRIPLLFELWTSLASSFAVVFVGCNDVVWFFPFAMHSRRWQFVALYMVMKEFFALFSWLVVALGHRLEDLYPGVPVERVLAVAAPALLALYALVLFMEWRHDAGDAPDADDDAPDGPKPLRHGELPVAAGCEQRLDLGKLGALCIIGNLDNLAVFVPGLEAGVFRGPQLAVGTFFAGVFVVAACVGASRLRSVARVAEAVPLWCVLAALAAYYCVRLLVGGGPAAH